MSYRFNRPPGWHVPAGYWKPPEGWQPEPWWPPAPAGWQFWVDDDDSVASSSVQPADGLGAYQPDVVPPTSALPAGGWLPAAGPSSDPSARRRRMVLWVSVGVTATLLLAAGVIAGVVLLTDGPTLTDAERECRTAIDREFSDRQARIEAQSGSTSVLVSVTDIELQEARKTDHGFEVNGVVHYDLTTALVPTVHNSLALTCEAHEQDGKLLTTVKNRG